MKKNFGIAKIASAITILALLFSFMPVPVQAAVSDYWSEEDIGVRLEPTYESIIYTKDPIEIVQPFDAAGDWYVPATSVLRDSRLNLTGATNASLNLAKNSNLDDGTYFEIRFKGLGTDGNTSIQLIDSADSGTVKIIMGANGKAYCSWPATAATQLKSLNTTYVANTWYRLGIFYHASAGVTFQTRYDVNYSVIGSYVTNQCNVTFAEIDKVNLAQSVATKTVWVDYFVQTLTREVVTPIGQASNALRVGAEEDAKRYNVAFTLDSIEDIVTLSNQSAVQTPIGYTATGIDVSNDNKINTTDLGEVITETPEDANVRFVGNAKIKGWDSVRDAQEETISDYLAKKHDVVKVNIIDYYTSAMKINISANKVMTNKIEKIAIQQFISMINDKGGTITYDSEVGFRSDYTDFDYAYIPRDLTSTQWNALKSDLSSKIRKEALPIVALTLDRPADLSTSWWERNNPLTIGMMAMNGEFDLDTTWQATNAFIGNILRGLNFMAPDANEIDSEMESNAASGWDIMDGGKATTGGLSMLSVLESHLDWVLVIAGIVLIAVVIIAVVIATQKHRKRKSS